MTTHVPTPEELAALGEAIPLERGVFRVLPAGHERMGAALRARASEPQPSYREAVIAARERANNAKAK